MYKSLIKLSGTFIMAVLLMACSSSSDDGGAPEVAEVEWGTGSYSALRKNVNMSDMETLVEYVAKVENLKLQTIKLFSKNWEGVRHN